VDERQVLPTVRRDPERVPDDPLHPVPGVDRLLDGHLVRRPLAMEPTRARVEPLGVLAHHDEVHVLFRVGRHERPHTRVPDHRAEVHVLVELEADPQEQVAFKDPGPHARIADGAEQDRVAALQAVELGVR
jgi:hypothetical protein